MTELLDISLKNIKDVEGLIELRNKIKKQMIELKDENNNILILLKKKYFNISNKITYINNKEIIIERNKEKNREYIKNNYEKIKDYNKKYQQHRREHYKELLEMFSVL